MRHRLAVLSLLAAATLTPALTTASPAHAGLTLQRMYYDLPYSICISFGQSGQQNNRWGTWWCSLSQPQNSLDPYPKYDLWAYPY